MGLINDIRAFVNAKAVKAQVEATVLGIQLEQYRVALANIDEPPAEPAPEPLGTPAVELPTVPNELGGYL